MVSMMDMHKSFENWKQYHVEQDDKFNSCLHEDGLVYGTFEYQAIMNNPSRRSDILAETRKSNTDPDSAQRRDIAQAWDAACRIYAASREAFELMTKPEPKLSEAQEQRLLERIIDRQVAADLMMHEIDLITSELISE